MSNYDVPETVLGAGKSAVNRKRFRALKAHILLGETGNEKY